MTEQQLLNRLLSSFSTSNDAFKTTSYADDAVTAGLGFVVEKNIVIPANSTKYMLLDYSTYIPDEEWKSGDIFIFPPSMNVNQSYVSANVYRGTNYTGGTEFNAINPNTKVAKSTSGTTWTLDPTGSNKGSLALEYLVGTTSTNQSGGGGTAKGLSFFIRPNTTQTLVEMINGNGTDIILHYGQLMFEI